MIARLLRTGVLIAAFALTGCTGATFSDGAGGAKAEKQLPEKVLAAMKTKGMSRTSPVMARIFKEEGKLEIWKQKSNGRFDLISSYDICKWSGELGPKFIEGDRQAPEGFYTVRPAQMNPKSSFHLAFNMGYPNDFDRANGRSGANLMVHGACSSSGCYSMTDAQIEEIYAFGRDAFRGGQTEFQIQAFPFRMTAANMARYRNDPNIEFWKMLKEGYDQFEINKVPPKVDVCEKRYVFNRMPEEGKTFSATAACPPTTQPAALVSAYQSYQATYDAAYATAVSKKALPPSPTIAGLKEASLVSEWTRKRAKGERVPVEPPSLNADGTISVSSRMGRIDSPAGKRQAEIDAAEAARKRAEDEKKALAQARIDRQNAEELAKSDASEPAIATGSVAAPAEAQAEPAPKQGLGLLGNARKRIVNIFGS